MTRQESEGGAWMARTSVEVRGRLSGVISVFLSLPGFSGGWYKEMGGGALGQEDNPWMLWSHVAWCRQVVNNRGKGMERWFNS